MIYTTLHVTETIFAFALVVLLVVILKKKNIISTGDIKSYSKLMTTAILPAVIFLQLSLNPVNRHQFILVVIMFTAGLLSMMITWIAGKLKVKEYEKQIDQMVCQLYDLTDEEIKIVEGEK